MPRYLVLAFVTFAACGRSAEPLLTPPPPPPSEQPEASAPSTPWTVQPAPTTPPAPQPTPTPSAQPEQPEDIGASHILIMYRGSLRAAPTITRTQAEARARAEEVLRRVRAGEDFSRLAAEYSDEPGAAERGGSLGRFRRGVMHPAFESAAFSLQVGQTSGIVETPFGYHIIKRTQ